MDLLEKVVVLENEASDFGFQWGNATQILDQIRSECQEIEEQLQKNNVAALEEEIGDLLHATFSLGVFCNFDPKITLEQTLKKFERRLQAVKAIAKEQGLDNLKDKNFVSLMEIWNKAKRTVG